MGRSKYVKVRKLQKGKGVPFYMSRGQGGGRPLAFKTVEELQLKIDEYFEWCDNKTKEIHSDKLGDMIVPDPQPYTMSGLARRLGVDRHTIVNYGRKMKFFSTIRAARNRVEEDVETRLMSTRNEKGAMFNLKNNFNWRDQQEIDHTTKGKELPTPIYGGKSTEQ